MTVEEKLEQYRAETGEMGTVDVNDTEFYFLMKDLEE